MNNSFWYYKDNENVENVINLNLVHHVRITSYLDGNYSIEFNMLNETILVCVAQDDYEYLMRRLGV